MAVRALEESGVPRVDAIRRVYVEDPATHVWEWRPDRHPDPVHPASLVKRWERDLVVASDPAYLGAVKIASAEFARRADEAARTIGAIAAGEGAPQPSEEDYGDRARGWSAIAKERREASGFILEAGGLGPKSRAAQIAAERAGTTDAGPVARPDATAREAEERYAQRMRVLIRELGRALGMVPDEARERALERIRTECDGLSVPVVRDAVTA